MSIHYWALEHGWTKRYDSRVKTSPVGLLQLLYFYLSKEAQSVAQSVVHFCFTSITSCLTTKHTREITASRTRPSWVQQQFDDQPVGRREGGRIRGGRGTCLRSRTSLLRNVAGNEAERQLFPRTSLGDRNFTLADRSRKKRRSYPVRWVFCVLSRSVWPLRRERAASGRATGVFPTSCLCFVKMSDVCPSIALSVV